MIAKVRIISLLASGTEIVCALGAGRMLVGRSHECDHPAWVRALPQCTEPAFDISVSSREIDAEVNRRIRAGEPLYRLDTELIRELAPDLVITQAHCLVCAVTPGDMERSGCPSVAPTVLALTAGSLAGIFEGMLQIAGAIGLEEKGRQLIRGEQQRLDAVRQRTAGLRKPTVAMLEWIDPIFAMGNWGPELVEIANGEPLMGHRGEHSAAVPAEQLRAADPEYLILAPCGFDLNRTLNEWSVLQSYSWWNELPAVREHKVAVADGNLFFNRSGMTISQTAEIIAGMLHGVTFAAPTQDLYWKWL